MKITFFLKFYRPREQVRLVNAETRPTLCAVVVVGSAFTSKRRLALNVDILEPKPEVTVGPLRLEGAVPQELAV